MTAVTELRAPLGMLVAMGMDGALCILIGVLPALFYSILPYSIDYNPYDAGHVLAQSQLLIFSILAFVFLMTLKIYPPELKSTVLNSDWLYRRMAPAIGMPLMRCMMLVWGSFLCQMRGFIDAIWDLIDWIMHSLIGGPTVSGRAVMIKLVCCPFARGYICYRKVERGIAGSLTSFVFALLLVWLTACYFGQVGADETVRPILKRHFVIERPGLGPVAFDVEVATTTRQHSYGLMFTPEVPPHTGMLFVFSTDQVRKFWMKNTPVSLDILFFDQSGILVSQISNTIPFAKHCWFQPEQPVMFWKLLEVRRRAWRSARAPV